MLPIVLPEKNCSGIIISLIIIAFGIVYLSEQRVDLYACCTCIRNAQACLSFPWFSLDRIAFSQVLNAISNVH